jgi:hypothetical protein
MAHARPIGHRLCHSETAELRCPLLMIPFGRGNEILRLSIERTGSWGGGGDGG